MHALEKTTYHTLVSGDVPEKIISVMSQELSK
jgi:hypothetical protein